MIFTFIFSKKRILQHQSRKYFNDLFWLALSVALTAFLTFIFFGKSIFNNELDIHLHDTYFIIPKWLFLTSLFLLITFIIFFIKAGNRKDNTKFANWICLPSGLALVITLTIFIKVFSQTTSGGWTVYPPLYTQGQEEILKLKSESLSITIVNVLVGLQLIILCMSLFIAYNWGKRQTKLATSKI